MTIKNHFTLSCMIIKLIFKMPAISCVCDNIPLAYD